jgi:hypothetical protein
MSVNDGYESFYEKAVENVIVKLWESDEAFFNLCVDLILGNVKLMEKVDDEIRDMWANRCSDICDRESEE